MPAISPRDLVDAILDAVNESGGSALLLSSLRSHPRKFLISNSDGSFSLWVYAWTLTHGGRSSLPNEYRIQMTSVQSPLESNPDGHTVLIGYENNLGMFAGFDFARHRRFTPGSPSIQVDIIALNDALQSGLSFHLKDNDEIAVGIRKDQFISYCLNSTILHKTGSDSRTLNLLRRVASNEPVASSEIEALTAERAKSVQIVSKLVRAGSFRQQVLDAYTQRCAVTRMQLKLVDAAHILPVASPGSTDSVSNGICLSPTYHRAFDNGLIYLDDEFVMHFNPERETQLTSLGIAGGLLDFKSVLDRKIHLPSNRDQWPQVSYIRKANKLRSIDRI